MNMKDLDFDDDDYKDDPRLKKVKKAKNVRQNKMTRMKTPKTKPKDGDYHLIAKQVREKKLTADWYSKLE